MPVTEINLKDFNKDILNFDLSEDQRKEQFDGLLNSINLDLLKFFPSISAKSVESTINDKSIVVLNYAAHYSLTEAQFIKIHATLRNYISLKEDKLITATPLHDPIVSHLAEAKKLALYKLELQTPASAIDVKTLLYVKETIEKFQKEESSSIEIKKNIGKYACFTLPITGFAYFTMIAITLVMSLNIIGVCILSALLLLNVGLVMLPAYNIKEKENNFVHQMNMLTFLNTRLNITDENANEYKHFTLFKEKYGVVTEIMPLNRMTVYAEALYCSEALALNFPSNLKSDTKIVNFHNKVITLAEEKTTFLNRYNDLKRELVN